MNKKDFLKAVRRSEEKFRADNIVVSTEIGDLCGKGIVEVKNGRFRIHVNLDADTHHPELQQGIKMRREFWLIKGLIDDEINFSVRSLPFNSSERYTFGQPQRSTLEFSANRMELAPTGFDCLTSQQVHELQQQGDGQTKEAASRSEVDPILWTGKRRN